jgi:ABC-2 type transport system ATP-binding protein
VGNTTLAGERAKEVARMQSAGTTPAIEILGLTKRFKNFVAVEALTFAVPAGAIFGFLGPNGAGKTTTIGMLLGLVPPDAGTARILGHDVRTDLAGALARTGALVERPAFYPYLSGRANLRLMARLAGVTDPARIEQVLAIVGLSDAANRTFNGYSQGMRQRLGIGAAIVADPEVIILDEPTNGLDPAGQREVQALATGFAEAGKTVLLSSHLLHEVEEICSHLAIIDRGKLVATGTLAEILATRERLIVAVDRPQEAEPLVRQLPGVEGIEASDGRLLIDVPFERAAEINRALVEAGFAVSELRRQESALEERFLALTQGTDSGSTAAETAKGG